MEYLPRANHKSPYFCVTHKHHYQKPHALSERDKIKTVFYHLTAMIHLCLLASCFSVMSLQESVFAFCKRRVLSSKPKSHPEQCKDLNSLKTTLFSSINTALPMPIGLFIIFFFLCKLSRMLLSKLEKPLVALKSHRAKPLLSGQCQTRESQPKGLVQSPLPWLFGLQAGSHIQKRKDTF